MRGIATAPTAGVAIAPAKKWHQQRGNKTEVGSPALPELRKRSIESATTTTSSWTLPHSGRSPAGTRSDTNLRRLPQLSKSAASWSTPSFSRSLSSVSTPVISRGAGGSPMEEIQATSNFTLPYPMLHRLPARAATASGPMSEINQFPKDPFRQTGMSVGSMNSTQQGKFISKTPNRPSKNSSVWHRWGLSVPSGREQREITLEKDREQSRQAFRATGGRDLASPARSHAAASFFPRASAQTDNLQHLPPGAFRRVARPQTGQMECMPNSVFKASSVYGLSGQQTSMQPTSPGGRERSSVVTTTSEELPEERDVFQNAELEQLRNVIENFAALTRPPEDKGLGNTSPSTEHGTIMRMPSSMNLSRSSAVASAAEKDPFVLRGVFCRMLLASGLCSSEGLSSSSSEGYSYHQCVALFDAHATPLGAFTGMPRSTLLRIFAKLLQREGAPPAPPMWDNSQKEGKTPQFAFFFDNLLRTAAQHYNTRQSRQDWVKRQTEETCPSQLQEIPASILQDVGEGAKLWPPLPPRSVTESQFKDYVKGFQEWGDSLNSQVPGQLNALRAHTDAVLHGEVLSGQLLEPEVLHFAERFQPLFNELFCAYADFQAPKALAPKVFQSVESRGLNAVVNGESERRKRLQHMSLSGFFQFCVDFGIFPNHASLQEIRQIYNTAEAIIKEDIEPMQLLFPGGQDETAYEQKSRSSSKMQPSRPTTRGTDVGSKISKAQYAAQMKMKKAAEAAAEAAATAAAAAEAALPKADLAVFDKAISEMTAQEIRTLAFFGCIQECLTERFLRLKDIIVPPDVEIIKEPEEIREPTKISHGRERRGSFSEDPHGHLGDDDHPKENKENRLKPITTRGRRGSAASEHSAAAAQAALEAIVKAAAEKAAAAVPKMLMVSAKLLLDGIAPMMMVNCPDEAEIQKMFGSVLIRNDPEDDVPTEIAIFQLDKVLQKAFERLEEERQAACFIGSASETLSSIEQTTIEILTVLDEHMLRESQTGMSSGDPFEAVEEVSPQMVLNIAEELGMDPERLPKAQNLGSLFADLGANDAGRLSRKEAYRAMALVRRARKKSRSLERRTQLSRLAGTGFEPPKSHVFGLAAFMECLLKIAFHRLGGKGGNEIQRGAPAWWKCAWLLSLLGGHFAEHCKVVEHEEHVDALARQVDEEEEECGAQASRKERPRYSRTVSQISQTSRRESSKRLSTWWDTFYVSDVAKYTPTLDCLALQVAQLFHSSQAEASILNVDGVPQGREMCRVCRERRSPSGWGSPSCMACGDVDTLCLPIERHLFADLLFTEVSTLPDMSECGEEESVLDSEA